MHQTTVDMATKMIIALCWIYLNALWCVMLLLDENLSPKLVTRLDETSPDVKHVLHMQSVTTDILNNRKYA